MTARLAFASGLTVLATAKASIATVTTTTFDFGTPDDINLQTVTASAPGLGFLGTGMRLLIVLDGTTAGTTDSSSYILQDAPDNAGSIGTPADIPAANLIYGSTNTIAAGTGDRLVIVSPILQAGRPWLRVKVSRAAGTTDTLVTKCVVLGIPQGLI